MCGANNGDNHRDYLVVVNLGIHQSLFSSVMKRSERDVWIQHLIQPIDTRLELTPLLGRLIECLVEDTVMFNLDYSTCDAVSSVDFYSVTREPISQLSHMMFCEYE